MEIRRRVGYPRSYFHVMNRGARKVSIFADDLDRRIFRGLLARFAVKHATRILSWCLMPNHYHLQSDGEGTPLSLMMRDLDRTYAQSFNERHGTTGCLFQGPFKSMLIRELDGLVYVNRYIHLNPVDLGQAPGSYRWSSCGIYLGVDPVPDWMDIEPVMAGLRSGERSDAESYAFYLQEGLVHRRKKKRRPLGAVEDFYTEWIRHLEERCIEKVIGREDGLARVSPATLATWLAHRVYDIPARQIAAFYGYPSPEIVRAICGRLQKRLSQDLDFRTAVESVTESTTLKR